MEFQRCDSYAHDIRRNSANISMHIHTSLDPQRPWLFHPAKTHWGNGSLEVLLEPGVKPEFLTILLFTEGFGDSSPK